MYRSAASVGTARIAPDIIVRMPSRALRVLRIVLSVRFGSARGAAQGLPDRTSHTRFEGSLSVLAGRHGAMNPARVDRGDGQLYLAHDRQDGFLQTNHQSRAGTSEEATKAAIRRITLGSARSGA